MSNIDKQRINRWLGMNVLAFAAVVGLLMAFSIANMVRGLAEREAETTIDDHHRLQGADGKVPSGKG